MVKRLVVEKQAFSFSDDWDVEKYDDHPDTKGFIGVVGNRKAVDLIGTLTEVVYLIEVKDYRGRRIENKMKFDGELRRHVAAKVYDTLAGLVLAHRTAAATTLWRDALAQCRKSDGVIRVVLWIEDDGLFNSRNRGKAAASIFVKELKRALRWLPSCHVFVVNRSYNQGSLPGVSVIDLPGAAGN